jgi:hypothetical protein
MTNIATIRWSHVSLETIFEEMKRGFLFHVFVLVLLVTGRAAAEDTPPPPSPPPSPYTLRPSVMAGLMQWTLLRGGNIAAQVKVGRFVAEYSHGQALSLDNLGGAFLTSDERAAGVSITMPWTTGGGVGFQITPYLHVLLEAKAHRYEVRGAYANETLAYTTFTVGPGVFYDIYIYKGLFVQPILRWWPTVASTYDGDGELRRPDGTTYRHERHDLLPFVNVNLGYTFTGI